MATFPLDAPPRPLILAGTPLPVVGRLRLYVCGITPYDVTHLGHAATYVWTDCAVRVLRAAGTAVETARNVTDVDDVLFAEARRRDMDYDWLAARQRFDFDRTMRALGVRGPDHEPTARQSVPQVIQLAQALLTRGTGYLRGGSVYARTSGAAAAAGLSDEAARLLSSEYGDDPADPAKEHPFDVPAWRAVTDNDPDVAWPSPWGPGRPGWHAECAAMVLATFGGGVDLHAGGAELRYPHHACETLLAEGATGVMPFARSWLHVGTVCLDGAKMAKSTGNLVLVDDLLAEHRAAAVRLLLLDRPRSQRWDYTPEALAVAEGRLDDLHAAGGRPTGSNPGQVLELLLADLDVAGALARALEIGGAAARQLISILALE